MLSWMYLITRTNKLDSTQHDQKQPCLDQGSLTEGWIFPCGKIWEFFSGRGGGITAFNKFGLFSNNDKDIYTTGQSIVCTYLPIVGSILETLIDPVILSMTFHKCFTQYI